MKKFAKVIMVISIAAGILVTIKLCLDIFGSGLKKYIKIDEVR